MLKSRLRQRQLQLGVLGQAHRDAGILGSVSRAEIAGMVPLLHVFTVSLQNPGIGTRLGKHLPKNGEIQTQRGPQAQALGQSRGVDVHHHVDQSFHLSRGSGRPNVATGSG